MKVRVGVAGVLALFLILAFGARRPVAADGPAGGALYGKFVWNDLLTKDLPAARAFYASMFGWTFREQTREGRPYLIAELDGKPVAGLLDVHDMKEADPQWVSFVSVPDVDAVAEQVRAAGGKVLVAPRAVKVGGRAAVVSDPQGAPLGLARLTGGDPADSAEPVVGRFFWAEYLAKDGPQALEFYKKLLGYDAAESDAGRACTTSCSSTTARAPGSFSCPTASQACGRTGCPICASRIPPRRLTKQSRLAAK